MSKTDYNLNSFFILENLFKVIIDKPSLTEENNFNMLDDLINNQCINYLSKIKCLNFKINNNYNIKLCISDNLKKYYNKFINILCSILINYEIVDINSDIIDIIIYTFGDKVHENYINKNIIKICINGEKDNIKEDCDISILTTKNFIYNYNIYFPQLFTSLWERRNNYNILLNNTKEFFCAYMYSYDIEYRVELYNFISKYKSVDALGKSCSNIEKSNRDVYNDDITYNDIAVEYYSKYKFVLSLENGIVDGYITEKLINPIIAGSIPIYAGPKDAFEIININRVIYVYNFKNYEDLLNYIIEVDNNEELYNYIVSQDIFIGNLNFNNFEDYLLNKLKKALSIENKNILITNNKNELINYNNIDYVIKNLEIPFLENTLVKRYLNNHINNNDNILYKPLYNIKFYLINLDHRVDRLNNALNQCYKNGIYNVERFSAIKPSIDDVYNCSFINIDKLWKNDINYMIGATGCKLSHYNICKKALLEASNYEYICILEDDVMFEEYIQKYLLKSIKCIEENNIDFDILFLASNLGSKEDAIKIHENLLRLYKGLTTTGQIFKYNKLEKIINIIENSDSEIDNTYRDFCDNKLCIYPMCVYQNNFRSDILNSESDYGNFHKKFEF